MISTGKAKTNLGFGLALGMLMGISVLSYRDADRLIDAARWVGHSGEVLARVKELEGSFNELVLIHSAYVARPEPVVVRNFEAVRQTIFSKANELVLLTHDNPGQQARLRVVADVAAQRLRPGQVSAALVDWMRGQISAVEHNEEKLLARRQEAEGHHALRAKCVIALGGALSALLVVGAVVIVNRDATRRQTVAQDPGRSKELAEAANPTKEEFLANMSQEIQTPSNGVPGIEPTPPAADGTPPETEIAVAESLPERQPMRILLAEDSTINQDVAIGQLKKLGYNPDVVNNGREVLEALEFIQYDVVLMDCHMPEMDGYQAARAIRERENPPGGQLQPPVYMIAMTASAMEGDRDLCLNAGMNDYLSKPVNSADLKAALERAALHQALAAAQVQVPIEAPLISDIPAEPEASPFPEDKPPVDVDRLRELTAGDPESLRRLIDRYIQEADEMMDRLGLAVQAAAAGEIRHWAHKLGGTSATVGITAVVPVLHEMEKLSSSGQLSTSHRLLAQVSFELSRTQRFLSEYLELVSRN